MAIETVISLDINDTIELEHPGEITIYEGCYNKIVVKLDAKQWKKLLKDARELEEQ